MTFCRVTDPGQRQPWCYTADPAVRTAECAVYECGRSVCGPDVFTDPHGVITSPGFPNNYPTWVKCDYTITGMLKLKSKLEKVHSYIFSI